ncbi:CBS domain-containing protein [Rhodoblastus sp.]|uniref:CBS domain-containing protein n=1 Tax=Rhodoblastus sp. TaxID=1962975 RepID=UPI003F9B3194
MLDIARAIENKHAGDAMTSPVVGVGPDDSARAAAEDMLRLHVSGLPVVDRDGRPLGVVSESDFRFADAAIRQNQREAWVAILAGGQDIAANYLEALEREGETVRQVMSRPALAVDEQAPLAEVAELMTARRVKRILVTRQDRLVGVITRADLLRFFTEAGKRPNAPVTAEAFEAACNDVRFGLAPPRAPAPKAPPAAPAAPEGAVTAASLKELVNAFERSKSNLHEDALRQAREKRDDVVKKLLAERFTDGELSHLMALAREAATRGESGVTALVFPAALCNDGGRMINLPDPDWPRSLSGKAADFYRRWDKELRPLGFGLSARIVTFPDGFPGDAELSLVWGR